MSTDPAIFESDVTVKKRLFVIGQQIAASSLVTKDSTTKGRTFVTGDTYLYKGLVVAGDTNVQNMTVNGVLTANFKNESIPKSVIASFNNVDDDFTIGKRLTVAGDVTSQSRLFVNNDATIKKRLFVNDTTTLKDLVVSGNVTMSPAPNTIPSTAIANRNIFVDDIYANNRLLVANTSTFSQLANFQDVSVNKTLSVKDVNITGNLTTNYAASSIPSTAIIGGALPANLLQTDVTMNKRLTVRDVSINTALLVNGNTKLQSLDVSANANFGKDVYINGNLYFQNNAPATINPNMIIGGVLPSNTLDNDVTFKQNIIANRDISLNRQLSVGNDATINGTLTAKRDIYAQGRLLVTNDTTMSGNVKVDGTLTANYAANTIASSAIIGGTLPANTFDNEITFKQSIIGNRDLSLNRHLFVGNDATINGTLTAKRDIYAQGRLLVTNDTTMSGNVKVDGTLTANYAPNTIASSAIIGGTLPANTLDNDVTFKQNIIANRDLSLNRFLSVGGESTFNGHVTTNRDIYAKERLFVTKDSTFVGNVTIEGALNVNATIAPNSITPDAIVGGVLPANTLDNDVTFKQSIIGNRDLSLNRFLSVGGETTFNAPVTTNRDIYAKERLFVTKDSTLYGNLIVDGTITANYAPNSITQGAIIGGALPANTLDNDVTFKQSIIGNRDLSINRYLTVGNAATFYNTLTSKEDIRAEKRLFVTKDSILNNVSANAINILNDSSFNGNLYVAKDLTVVGRISALQFENTSVVNNTTVTYTNITTEDISVNGNVFVDDNIKSNKLFVKADISSNRLFVVGKTVLNDVSINGLLSVTHPPNSISASAIIGGVLPANTFDSAYTFNEQIICMNDLSLNRYLRAAKNATFYDQVYAEKSVQVKEDLKVTGNTIIDGILTANFDDESIPSSKIIGGILPANTLTEDVTFDKQLTAQGDILANNKIWVQNNATFYKNIYGYQEAQIQGNLQVSKDAKLTRAFVSSDAVISGNVTVSGKITGTFPDNSIPQSAVVGLAGGQRSAASLIFDTDTTMEQNLYVTKDISSGGVLHVNGVGTSTFGSNLTVNGTFSAADYEFNSIPTYAINGLNELIAENSVESNFNTDVSMNKGLFVNHVIRANRDISANGNLYVHGSGKSVIQNDLSVNGILSAKFANNSIPTAAITDLSGYNYAFIQSTFNGDVSLNNRLYVKKMLTVFNDISLSGRLYMHGAGTSIIQNDLSINGTFSAANYAVNNIPINAISGLTTAIAGDSAALINARFKEDISMNKRLHVASDILAKRLLLQDDISSNGRLYVSGAGTSIIQHDLSVNGIIYGANYAANSVPVSAVSGLTPAITTVLQNSFSQDVSMNKRLHVTSDVLAKRLYLQGDISANGNLFILGTGKSIIQSDLSVNGTIYGASYAPNSISTNAISGLTELIASSNTSQLSSAFNEDVTMNRRLFVARELYVTRDISTNGNLYISGSGKSIIQSDLSVNGTISANYAANSIPAAAINALSTTVATIAKTSIDSKFSEDVSMNKRLHVTSDVLAKRLYLQGDISTNGNLYILGSGNSIIQGDLSVNGTIYGASYAPNSISTNAISGLTELIASSNTSQLSSAFSEDVTMDKRLFVSRELNVARDISANGNLYILGSGKSVIQSDLSVNGTFSANYATNSVPTNAISGLTTAITNGSKSYTDSKFSEDVSMNKRLHVANDVLARRLFLVNDISTNGNLYISGSGKSIIQTDLSVNGTFNANYATNSIPTTAISGLPELIASSNTTQLSSAFSEDVTMNKRLFVSRELYVTKDISANGNLYISGSGKSIIQTDLSVNGTFSANYAANSISTNAISGLTTAITNGSKSYVDSKFSDDVSMNKRLHVANDVLARRLFLQSDISTNGNLYISGSGKSIIQGDLSVNGAFNFNYATNSVPITAVSGLTTAITNGSKTYIDSKFSDDVSMNKRLHVTSDVLAKRLFLQSDISTSGNLFVVGSGKSVIQGDLSVNGIFNANYATNSIPATSISGLSDAIMATQTELQPTFSQDVSMNKNASVKSNLYVNDALFVTSTTSKSIIQHDLSVNGTFAAANYVANNIPMSAINGLTSYVNTSADQRIGIAFSNNVTLADNLTVNKDLKVRDISMTGALYVKGTSKSVIERDLSINGTLYASSYAPNSISTDAISGLTTLINNSVNSSLTGFSGDDITFGGSISTQSDATVGRTLYVSADISAHNHAFIKKNLIVGNDVSINGKFWAGSFTDNNIPVAAINGLTANTQTITASVIRDKNLYEDLSLNKRLYVQKDIESFANIRAGQNLITSGRLFVNGTSSSIFNGDISVNGTISANNYKDSSIPLSAVSGLGALVASATGNNEALFTDDISLSKSLYVEKDISSNGLLYISGTGTSVFKNNLNVNNNLNVLGTLTASAYATNSIQQSAIIGLESALAAAGSSGTFNNDVTITKRLLVTDDISSNGRLYVSGAGTSVFKNNLNINNNLNVLGTLTASTYAANSIQQSAIIGLEGALAAAGSSGTFNNDVTMSKRLFVTDDISSNGRLYVSGAGTSVIKNNLNVLGTLTASTYAANSIQTSAINGLSTYVNGLANTAADQRISIAFSNNVTLSDNLTVNKRLFVADDISSNGRLYVSGAGTSVIKNHLNVAGILTAGYNNKSISYNAIDFTGASEYIPASAIIGSSSTSTSFTGNVTVENSFTALSTASFNAGINVTGDAVITGNLSIAGTTTTINAANLDISDNIIMLASGTTTAAYDSGIMIERGSAGDNAFMGWDSSEGKFVMGTTAATGTATTNLTINKGTIIVDLEGTVNTPVQNTITTMTGLKSIGNATDNITLNGNLNMTSRFIKQF